MRYLIIWAVIFLILPLSVFAQVENSQAANELQFLTPIYNRYIGNLTNYDAIYAPAFQYAVANTGLNSYYRELCTQISVNRLVEGANFSATDKPVVRLVNTYTQANFRSLVSDPWNWLIGAPAFDCMIAANLGRNAIPTATLNPFVDDLAYFARCMLNGCAFSPPLTTMPALTTTYYQTNWTNKGNTPAEEANATATFLLAAAQLLPASGHGAITPTERSAFYTRAKDLLQFTTTHCAAGCSFQPNQYLVINHQINPNPNYTTSWLTGYSEAGMLFRQENLTLPTDIFSSTITTAIGQTAQALQSYLTPSFGYTGTFNIIDANGTPFPHANFDFGNMKHTLRNPDLTSPVNSSIPTDHVDSMNAFILSGTTNLKEYVFSGNKAWHYICDLGASPTDCWAEYQSPISTFWQSTQAQSTAWSGFPPPGKVDAMTQWYLPNTTQLKSYIWSGNRVWHYICDAEVCTAQYTQTLSQSWPTANWTAAGWTTTPPPTDSVDAMSQFIVPGTATLKSYIFKGGQMWSYQCDNIGTSQVNCSASYTKTLASFWQSVTGTWSTPPPTDRLDSMHQFYASDGLTLKSYAIKDNQVWVYTCTSAGCNVLYNQTLNQFFGGIRETYKWPFESAQGSGQIVGVTDWGMDATFQNDAFSAIAQFAPQYTSMYTNLQAEELRRGRQNEPPLPPNFVNGNWQDGDFQKYYQLVASVLLTDGWLNRNPDGSPVTNPPPTLGETVNYHEWLNFLAAKNGLVAYLFTTNSHYWLKRFDEIIPGDLNQDFRVDGTDAKQWATTYRQAGSTTLNFAPVSLNFGK